MRPETFIILSPGFPANETDSTCLPAQQLFVKNLQEKFPTLQIVILSFQYPYAAGEYKWQGCKVVAFGGKGKGKLFRLLLWRKAWKKLQDLNHTHTITGLLSFWCGECALIGSRFGKKNKILHKCWILGQDAKADNRYVQRIKPSTDELVAMSDFLQEVFLKNHAIRPAFVIPNGIDKRSFRENNTSRHIDILGVGSLITLKQYDVFIGIIAAVKRILPGTKAVICGKGPEEKALKELITRKGLSANILLVGEQPHAGVLELMQTSKVFLHCASYEGFGGVCIEALYAGTQVISFNRPMKAVIPHWQIAETKEDMVQKTLTLLQAEAIDHSPVCPYQMEDSVREMMKLFGLHPPADMK